MDHARLLKWALLASRCMYKEISERYHHGSVFTFVDLDVFKRCFINQTLYLADTDRFLVVVGHSAVSSSSVWRMAHQTPRACDLVSHTPNFKTGEKVQADAIARTIRVVKATRCGDVICEGPTE